MSQNIYFKLAFMLSFLINNGFTLIVELIFSYLTIKYCRKFVNRHKRFRDLTHHQMWLFNSNTSEIFQISVFNQTQNESSDENNQINLIYNIHKNITRFAITLTIFSVLCNLFSLSLVIFFTISKVNHDDTIYSIFYFIYAIFYLTRHGSIFFFLVFFNKKLRNYFFKC